MTTSEKQTIIDLIEHEIQSRTREYKRVSVNDDHALCRCAGRVQESEKILRDLRTLLRKL